MLVDLPKKFPFPYKSEKFSKKEKIILSRFFTNTDKPVFAIFGLPQEIVGALFSRYSRTTKSIRRVFLDEFWSSEDLGIGGKKLEKAQARTQDFYRRVFAEFGDDSVIQMGSIHVAFEFVSQIAAKAIEDGRIAAAYIEKSTRYVDFGNKADGHYLYTEVPEIMESEFVDEFIKWNESLFDSYVKHLLTTRRFLEKKYPFSGKKTGEAWEAYQRALKAKILDTVRVFLPTTTVTNLGAHFSGQAAENALNKMIASPYSEVRLLGKMALEELMKVSPNFLQHVDHPYGERTRNYFQNVRRQQEEVVEEVVGRINKGWEGKAVQLIDWDRDADVRLASQIIYTAQKYKRRSKTAILAWVRKLNKKQLQEIIVSSVPDRSAQGLNRRHKLPRAFEHVFAEVEFNVDFGIFRDLQRNRMSSTERQALSAEKRFVPKEFREKGMARVLKDYLKHVTWTRKLHKKISKSSNPDLARAAEYVTIFGNKLRFNIRANIRQWVFFAELRTIEGGHPSYRDALQKATRQIIKAMPFLKPLFAHVNWRKDCGLGRLKAEIKTQQKLKRRPLRIGIMGGMGSGKSTLTELLAKRWGVNPAGERFEENPYLGDFYKRPKDLSFRSQICFLALNRERMQAVSGGPVEIFEAPIQNDNLFCQTQYEVGFMNEDERNLYLNFYDEVTQKLDIVMPDFYIVVDASAEVLYERTKKRGRGFEHREFFEQNPNYLKKLVNNVAKWTKKATEVYPVVIVDSVKNNLVDNKEDRERIFEQIENEITVFLSRNPCGKDGVQFIIPDFLKNRMKK